MRLHELGVEGIVNVGSADAVDKAEFGRVVARGFGLDPDAIEPIALAERRLAAARPLDPTMDVSRLTRSAGAAADGRGGRRAPAPRARGRHRGARSAAAAGARCVELLGREAA